MLEWRDSLRTYLFIFDWIACAILVRILRQNMTIVKSLCSATSILYWNEMSYSSIFKIRKEDFINRCFEIFINK